MQSVSINGQLFELCIFIYLYRLSWPLSLPSTNSYGGTVLPRLLHLALCHPLDVGVSGLRKEEEEEEEDQVTRPHLPRFSPISSSLVQPPDGVESSSRIRSLVTIRGSENIDGDEGLPSPESIKVLSWADSILL